MLLNDFVVLWPICHLSGLSRSTWPNRQICPVVRRISASILARHQCHYVRSDVSPWPAHTVGPLKTKAPFIPVSQLGRQKNCAILIGYAIQMSIHRWCTFKQKWRTEFFVLNISFSKLSFIIKLYIEQVNHKMSYQTIEGVCSAPTQRKWIGSVFNSFFFHSFLQRPLYLETFA